MWKARRGGLACLGPPSLGLGPLNGICDLPAGLDWEASCLAAGQSARIVDGGLDAGGRCFFSLDDAALWRPTAPPAGWTDQTLSAGLVALAAVVEARKPAGGLAPLVSDLALGGDGGSKHSAEPLLRVASEGVKPLIPWLVAALAGESADESVPEAARRLIGLGPGLTPSGDDLLGGAMIALRALGRADVAGRLAAWALSVAEKATGKISFAHLQCAADGEGAAALHDTLAAVMSPGAPGLAECLAAIDAIGHTSGWDALAGAMAVLSSEAR